MDMYRFVLFPVEGSKNSFDSVEFDKFDLVF